MNPDLLHIIWFIIDGVVVYGCVILAIAVISFLIVWFK